MKSTSAIESALELQSVYFVFPRKTGQKKAKNVHKAKKEERWEEWNFVRRMNGEKRKEK